MSRDNTSGASAVATTLDASTATVPARRIIIVGGAHVKINMVGTNKRWNQIITPPPAVREALLRMALAAASAARTRAVAAKSCDGGATAFPVTIAVTVAFAASTVVFHSPAGCCVDASASCPLDSASPLNVQPWPIEAPPPLVHWNLSFCLPLVRRQVVALSVVTCLCLASSFVVQLPHLFILDPSS